MRNVAATLFAAAVLVGCTPRWKQTPHDQLFQKERVVALVKQPEPHRISDWWDRGTQILVRPLGRALSPGRLVERLVGGRPALDANAFGEVPDSEWYENRISKHAFTTKEAFDGATRSTGPALGPLYVISGKLNGASPGFVVRDTENVNWYLKLDPPASPELSTSAETISSRLLYMAGYHVAEIHAIDVEPRRFIVDSNATKRDTHNEKIKFTEADLKQLMGPLNTDANGRIRVLASRQPEGEVLGPFDYQGTVSADTNDRIAHEMRRSLRGLWVFAAWINNTDTRNQNSLDVWRPVSKDGKHGIVRHFLLDFGNSFGATGTGEKSAGDGDRYTVDWRDMGANLVNVGLRYPPRFKRSPYRSVGLFESKLFDPTDWHPNYRNPAFDARTRADLFWGASVLARIQPDHIRAAVAAGYFHEEGAAEYLITTLLERRRKLLTFAFKGFLEIDEPRTKGTTLIVDDLRALGGLASLGNINYQIKWNHTRGRDVVLVKGILGTTTMPEAAVKATPPPPVPTLDPAAGSSDAAGAAGAAGSADAGAAAGAGSAAAGAAGSADAGAAAPAAAAAADGTPGAATAGAAATDATPATPAPDAAPPIGGELPIGQAASLTELQIDLTAAIAEARKQPGFAADPFLTITFDRLSTHAKVHLRVVGDRVIPVALER